MNQQNPVLIAIVSSVALMLASAPASAYLDPGSGSALLQGILAAFAAIALTLKLYWHRLLRLLGLKKKPRSEFDVEAYMESDETDDEESGKTRDAQ